MKSNKNKVIIFIMLLFSSFIISCGGVIEGKISVKGNEPHTYLSITTSDGKEFRIVGKLENEIWKNYQGNTIKVKGKIVKEGVGISFPPQLEVKKIIK